MPMLIYLRANFLFDMPNSSTMFFKRFPLYNMYVKAMSGNINEKLMLESAMALP
jgi:hypothetical protein